MHQLFWLKPFGTTVRHGSRLVTGRETAIAVASYLIAWLQNLAALLVEGQVLDLLAGRVRCLCYVVQQRVHWKLSFLAYSVEHHCTWGPFWELEDQGSQVCSLRGWLRPEVLWPRRYFLFRCRQVVRTVSVSPLAAAGDSQAAPRWSWKLSCS